jgi:hypothetical protein
MKVGGDFGWKAIYLRIPRAEDSRLISGLLYKLTRTAAGDNPGQWGGLLDFGAGQFPSVNPALTIPMAWGQAFAGGNPTDSLRGRTVIPDREFRAGGASILEPMFQWTLSESGYNNFVSWNPNADTFFELGFSAIPGINRMVKISDYGMREQQRQEEQAKEGAGAKEFLRLPDDVQRVVSEHNWLERLGRNRTPEQEARYAALHAWKLAVYAPSWEAITAAAESGRDASGMRQVLGQSVAGMKR